MALQLVSQAGSLESAATAVNKAFVTVVRRPTNSNCLGWIRGTMIHLTEQQKGHCRDTVLKGAGQQMGLGLHPGSQAHEGLLLGLPKGRASDYGRGRFRRRGLRAFRCSELRHTQLKCLHLGRCEDYCSCELLAASAVPTICSRRRRRSSKYRVIRD